LNLILNLLLLMMHPKLNVALLALLASASPPGPACGEDANSAVCMLQLRSRDEYDDRWASHKQSQHPKADQPGHTAHDLDDIADFFGHLPQADAPRRSEAAEPSLSFAQGSDAAAEKAGTAQPSPNPILEAEAPKGPPNTDTDTQGLPHGHSIEGEGVASDPLEKLAPHHHGHDADHTECPGGPYIGGADTGTCFHAGAEIRVGFGKEERQDIEDSFGDNVLMKEWKYFKEGCHKPAQCEFIDPDVNHHQFPVGKSVIRVEGIDIAGNVNHCHRTVYVVDEESPKFVVPSKEVDPSIEIDFPENTCSVTADKPFLEYEEVNGFIDEATDNCDKTVTIVKKLKNAQGDIVYDSSKEGDLPELKGPNQTYTLIYEAIDDYSAGLFAADAPEAVKKAVSRKRIHEASLTLNDVQPPYDFEGCPSDFFVEIEAHETKHTGVFWSPPTVTGDNCEEFGGIPDAEEQTKPLPMYPGMPLEIGAHPIQYAFKDASGNYIQDKECTFTITVEQKAHPVTLTCPTNVTVPTLLHADFGLPIWDEPVAMQGGKILDSSHITYPQGVETNMPFPFGTTVITVKATGEITGKRKYEDQMFDECTFTVTVTDPQIPKVDGRMYRCKDSNRADSMGFASLHGKQPPAKPYEVCGGLALDWMPHDAYVETHHYDVKYSVTRDYRCCRSEMGVDHVCKPVPGTKKSSYCAPEEEE
jgi:hypothetical protein